MSARQLRPASLANAQQRIENMRDELDWTVESVERLERIGRHDLALRLVDEQRSALDRFVSLVTAEVATPPRSNRRRRVAILAAASVALVLAFASIGIAKNQTSPIKAVNSRLVRAEAIADPVARLRELISIYNTARTMPAAAALRTKVAEVARRTVDTVKHDDDGNDADVLAQANGIVDDARGAPSTGASPVQQLMQQVGTS
jgi:hypothetical protein